MKFPKISVNIPLIPNGNPQIVLDSLKKVHYPKNLIEIIIISGSQIAKQRNKGLKHSKGDIIYLLDNDSEVIPNAFKILASEFKDPKIAVVGGPSLTPKTGNYLNRLIGYVLETYFGAFRMKLKWSQGTNNHPLDYHFLGANLALRKKIALKVGGFDEKIVPNEETELVRRIKNHKYLIKYNRDLIIYRNQRDNLKDLIRQFSNYGKGRMKFMKKNFIPQDILLFSPVLFSFYLLSLIFYHPTFYLTPVVFYILLAFATSTKASIKYKNPSLFLSMPFIFPVIHISYGLGLLKEVIEIDFRKKIDLKKVKVIHIKNFQEK